MDNTTENSDMLSAAEFGGENAKVCFVNSEESGLAIAVNVLGVMGNKVGKYLHFVLNA